MTPEFTVQSDLPLPAGFLDAFLRYDRALLAGDADALTELFEDGAATMRADPSGVVVGSEALRRFRLSRPDRPTRTLTHLHARVVSSAHDAELVYTTAEVTSASGSAGLQTQLWRRTAGTWRIVGAHVTPPSRAMDSTVWRVVGDPLVPATRPGPLTGHTLAVKDLYAVAGLPRSGGVAAYLAQQAPQTETAAAVVRLLAAGAEVTGLTHTDQFAFGLAGQNADYGTPVNRSTPTRIPGGSTSGSACAVRNGWVSVGLGTDTAGSIRVPSSYQELWGFRPTHGAIDASGLLALAPSFDTVGWITRDADTLLAVGEVLLPDDGAPLSDAAPVRAPGSVPESDSATAPAPATPVISADVLAPAVPGIRDAVLGVASELGAEELPPLPDLQAWTAAFRTAQAHEAWAEHGAWITANPGALAPDVAARFELGRQVDDVDLAAARTTLVAARETMSGLLAGRYLILPTVGSAAPLVNAGPEEIDAHRGAVLRLTTLASLTGFPAVSIPALEYEGAPLGLSLVGAPGTDRALLQIARDLGRRLAL